MKRFERFKGYRRKDQFELISPKMPVLGFDHRHIFSKALQRLKSKIQYYPVGFELLDEFFTMTELHELYECILQTSIDRRKILDSE